MTYFRQLAVRVLLPKDETRLVATEAGQGDQVAAPIYKRVYSARDLGDWYCLGVTHERERAAGARFELDTSWTRSGAEVAESRYASMMRTFEEAAQLFHVRELGREYVPYMGWAA